MSRPAAVHRRTAPAPHLNRGAGQDYCLSLYLTTVPGYHAPACIVPLLPGAVPGPETVAQVYNGSSPWPAWELAPVPRAATAGLQVSPSTPERVGIQEASL